MTKVNTSKIETVQESSPKLLSKNYLEPPINNSRIYNRML